jgi:hypothetical protein
VETANAATVVAETVEIVETAAVIVVPVETVVVETAVETAVARSQ